MATDTRQQVQDAKKDIDLQKKTYTVELQTNKGPIRLKFLPEVAPGHVENFVALARIGFYNNGTFHRVIKGFMIQGGCPEGTGMSGPGYKIPAEFNATRHEPGVLSMARTSDPNSAGSQFFICLERQPSLDNKYTVFGKVADDESLQTVKKIGDVKTGANDKPVDKVVIEKATVTEQPR
jgi:peptidyl-prolyl cis-trans isomerase B (cyclophilin B)